MIEYPDMAYTRLMGSVAAAPNPKATKYVNVGIQTLSVATMTRSITMGIMVSKTHSLFPVSQEECHGTDHVMSKRGQRDSPLGHSRILLDDPARC